MSSVKRNPAKKPQRKSSLKHPFAAIEHRVIDSPAFADIRPSSARLLLILARQLTIPANNGHLQATWSYCRVRGFGSENTLREAIYDLIGHGLICRTRCRGPNKAWARYAVTWLPVKNETNIFTDGFQLDAWKLWKKSTPKKLLDGSSNFHGFTPLKPANSERCCPSKTDDYECMPHIAVKAV